MLARLKPHGSIRRDVIEPAVLAAFLSEGFLVWRRKVALFISNLKNTEPCIDIFVAADDAHSYVALQCAQKLLGHYRVRASVAVLPPGLNGWAASLETERAWAARDAGLLAALYGLPQPQLRGQDGLAVLRVTGRMQAAAGQTAPPQAAGSGSGSGSEAVGRALCAMRALWGGEGKGAGDEASAPIEDAPVASGAAPVPDIAALDGNAARLKRLGYYNPGAVHFRGEWYPPNRLHHLERRLRAEGLGGSAALLFNQEIECEQDVNFQHIVASSSPRSSGSGSSGGGGVSGEGAGPPPAPVELFYSFRSPYSQLLLPRLRRLCSHYRRGIVLRPLLPMVSRGLEVGRLCYAMLCCAMLCCAMLCYAVLC
jgi:hypothetical protein